MKILITNILLAMRTGTELLVEQTADWLRQHGHSPIIYAPLVGPLGEGMISRGHRVHDRIEQIQEPPDVIHGHHAGPTMTALAAFPSVPAMFVANSAESEYDRPPRHPNIRGYFAVSQFLRERWASRDIPAASFGILGNPVDLRLFPPRPPLPERPRKALLLAKYDTQLDALREACRRCGLEVEEVGSGVGRVVGDLPARFREADIVFASGRGALEAAATGCAVVLTEGHGLHGMVRAEEVDHIVNLNWGIRLLRQPPTAEAIGAAIAAYDAADTAAAAARVRMTCSQDAHGHRLIGIYESLCRAGPGQEGGPHAVAGFLESYVPSFAWDRWRSLARCFPAEHLPPPLLAWAQQAASAHHEDSLEDVLQEARREGAALRETRDALREERDTLCAKQDALRAERDALRMEQDALRMEQDALRAARDGLRAERDGLREAMAHAQRESDALLASTSWRLTAPLRRISQYLHRAG